MKDQALEADIRAVLNTHLRLSGLDIDYQVKGQVAHVQGRVSSDDVLHDLRRAIARIRGIHAVWDQVDVTSRGVFRALDVGCGHQKQVERAIGMDRRATPAVDVISDLEKALPFDDESFDAVFAVHVLEHLRELIPTMNELHRVLRRGQGVLHVMVPRGHIQNALADPTHVRFFNLHTFKYFCRENPDVRPFRPLLVSESRDNIFADLIPVDSGDIPGPLELARFFDG